MIRNLCISGAGTQGPALMGAIMQLQKEGKLDNVRDVCGVSFGAMLAYMWSLGIDLEDLCTSVLDVNVELFFKINVREFFNKYGLSETDEIINLMKNLMVKYGHNPDMTFREHIYKTDIMLRVPSLCLNNHTLVYFSSLTHPELPVIDAIRASISIPLLFSAPIIKDHHYVDGGVIRHVPYDPYVGHEDKTLCVKLKCKQPYMEKINTMSNFIMMLMTSLHQSANEIPKEFNHLIEIDSGYSSTNFSIKRQDMENMMLKGIKAIQLFVMKPSEYS